MNHFEHIRAARHALKIALGVALALFVAAPAAAQIPPVCQAQLDAATYVYNDFGFSECQLCGTERVRLIVENPLTPANGPDISNLVIIQNLGTSGLTYAGNTTFDGINVSDPAVVVPSTSGPNNSILTWTINPSSYSLDARAGATTERIVVEFDVTRDSPPLTHEGLVDADRTIQPSVTFVPDCALSGDTYTDVGASGVLAIEEPQPVLTKQGRNTDAGQGAGSYSDIVYGHEDDDVIWRIEVENTGDAPLEDFIFDDTINAGNFLIDWVCPTEASASAPSAPTCTAYAGVTSVADIPIPTVAAGSSGFAYVAGRLRNSCNDQTNTAENAEWGCLSDSNPPLNQGPGGIDEDSNNVPVADATADLETSAEPNILDVDVFMEGVSGNPNMGARGQVRLRITNNTGGTIKGGGSGIEISNLLPAEYVVDTTFTPTLTVAPAYGNTYTGIVDTVAWINQDANPLNNRDLDFQITSSNGALPLNRRHLIRHGDVVTVTFQVVLIESDYYDRVADLDVIEEVPAGIVADTDPRNTFQVTNELDITFQELCNAGVDHTPPTYVDTDTANPEDLDVDFDGTNINFIVTSTGDPVPLTIRVNNRGGHDAEDYFVYATFGEAMSVTSAPGTCTDISTLGAVNNVPNDGVTVWQFPTPPLPVSAQVFRCTPGTVSRFGSIDLDFEVVKNTGTFDDDLTFRADAIGEIRLSNGTLLTFPAPIARSDGITDAGNNYSNDSLRARVVGFDLLKDQVGNCTEDNIPLPPNPDDRVQIGEECRVRIQAGNWFGFDTPGFDYIAVQTINVVDTPPDGQGFLRTEPSTPPSTAAISGVTFAPPTPNPLGENAFDWTFNTLASEQISTLDEWFRAEVEARILNDPTDLSAAPNQHAALSRNVLTSTFDAIFDNPLANGGAGGIETYGYGINTIGFPAEVHRRFDLTVVEPLITVTKEVCNEDLYGAGPSCSNFVTLADDGDAFDTYIYRTVVTNEASASGEARAPAYDVTVTTDFDPSDLMFIDPLTGDTLDNDGDSLVDGADAGGEGSINDNVTENGTPAQFVIDHTHSAPLLRIDAGDSVTFYYRVDPDDDVAPLQTLDADAVATYDSLEGAGNQTAPVRPNGDPAGARQYTSAPATARIQIIPVEVDPKAILRTSNTPLATPQNVSIGEEIEFELRAQIPVAKLRNFTVRDELPVGLSCAHAPDVNLDAAPYNAAGFIPGGTFTPTCTDSLVLWEFGDQTLTMTPGGSSRFDFPVDFIARVDNIATNEESDDLVNGGAATVTNVSYIDDVGVTQTLQVGEATVTVREPDIDLTKAFSVTDVDAGDLPRVTVTLTNNGTATAYNPRILEDLTGTKLTYQGDIQGATPPSDDVVTFGADRPLFTWAPGFGIAAGASVSFSFAVSVDLDAEPLELLDNTIQADWTSLPSQNTALNPSGAIGANGAADGMRNGALPNAGDALNDYEDEVTESVPVRPVLLAKTDLSTALDPEIGTHKNFELLITLPEGTTRNVVLTDDLDVGAVSYVLADTASFDITYQFEGIDTIAGAAPTEAALAAVPSDGDSGVITWTVGTVVTQSEDDLVATAITPTIRIRYFARVNNDLVTDSGDTLQNGAAVTFPHGETGLDETVVDDTAAIVAIEPALTATKALSNVTAGKAAGDPPEFGDTLQYVLTIPNGGNATAYDVNIVDTLPPELTLLPPGSFTPTASIGGTPVAGFVSAPAGAPSGPLVWGKDNSDGSLDLPAGSTLTVTYQVEVTTAVPGGGNVDNQIYVDWTSLQDTSTFERTGAGCPTITAPNDYCFGPAVASGTLPPIAPPDPLLKENSQATAAIGEAFVYRITVPSSPYAFAQYDVQITDDLVGSAADLRLLSVAKVSGSGAWTPTNTGTPTAPVIQDTTIGIDIPAGEQVVLDLTVVLQNNPAVNTSGLPFTNTANFTYNWINGDNASVRPGQAGTSPPMTIVGPDSIIATKSGPASMTLGVPGAFTLDLANAGTGTAWNFTLLDQLPDGATGGTCDTAPTVNNVQVFEANGTTAVSAPLLAGTDYALTFRPAPNCELELAMLSAATAVGPTERLIVQYETTLDFDTQDGATLTNVAGAVEWFSADGTVATNPGAADRRTFPRVLTDGSLDHEDSHTVNTALPQLRFEKTVQNLTTTENPATSATPGDTLRYQIRVENLTAVAANDFAIRDELDRLNTPPLFEAGTLTNVVVPAGTDATGSDPNGGPAGTGLLDVTGLSLPNLGDSLIITFDVTLTGVIANASILANQSQLLIDGTVVLDSDDPGVNGQADPLVAGDEDPTQVPIVSAPDFLVQKISTDLTDDPNVLLAGETLRYTITVENVGTDHATDALLRDAVPVNTTYVTGSTTLNGTPIADGAGGTAPTSLGIPIQAAGDPTPGSMQADATPGDDVATIVFDVVVDPAVVDGTVISNQAFVSAPLGGVVDQPSDDPGTALPDDPTLDVVGNAPLLFAPKSVVIAIDNGSPGVVDPLDTLRYTITVTNSGAVPATLATLIDAVPANTTWVANSLRLNTIPVGVPDGGVSPLAAGIGIASSGNTPPLPGPAGGTISPGESATIEFDLQVNAGTPSGTLISNQATVRTAELPNLLTDGDGNPATGPEPTVVVVGAGQQLSITKQVSVVGGGAAVPGGQLEYVVRVANVATVAATDVVITDDFAPLVGQLTYTAGSASLNGLPAGVVFAGNLLTADYSATYGTLAPGASAVLRFRADIDAGLANGTNITNTGTVNWNNPPQTASASVSIAVGGMPGVGLLNGRIWHDIDFDDTFAGGDLPLASWSVELVRNGTVVQTVQSDANGNWTLSAVAPNDQNGDQYVVRFQGPGAGANTASLGLTNSAFTDGQQQISNVVVPSGSNLQALNLPIDPNGVVYGALGRAPVDGASVSMLSNATGIALPTSCFDDPNQQGQVTRSDGYYKFALNFSNAACPSGGTYRIAITAPSAFDSTPSAIIPPQSDTGTPAYVVPICPGDAIGAPAGFCERQSSPVAPPLTFAPRSPETDYELHVQLDGSTPPGTSQLFNNHIALDPVLSGNIAISKSTPSRSVIRGALVPYEITVRNALAVDIPDLTVIDRFPPGFRYIEGSARVDGVPTEPTYDTAARQLTWTDVGVDAAGTRTIALLLGVGAGVTDGKFVNRAQAVSSLTGSILSGEATATVAVTPDPTLDCTDVIGKVFDDKNRDGHQDPGELGLGGVRLVTARGLTATTDAYGRYHITCAVVPNEDRGSNFILKLDERSLPSGYRMSTRPTSIQRATAGKALRFNYGASVHRVIGLDLADAVFEPGTTDMRAQWTPRLGLLIDELAKSPATLRLSYVGDVEDPGLVKQRLAAVKTEIGRRWSEQDQESLDVETEIYWRRGGPVTQLSRSLSGALSSLGWFAGDTRDVDPGGASERQLPPDAFTAWTHDPERLAMDLGDRLEERPVIAERAETVKLKSVVPPIRFASGAAEIPPSSVLALRQKLQTLRGLDNVRLHLVGHADNRPLRASLAARYGDNEGLSHERAGEVAEHLQRSLGLPPEAISFAYAGDEEPVATNATEAGRAQNRRVEVEVWYDETRESERVEEVVIAEDIKRVKVCRTETVCKLRYQDGHERRARIRNLIAPLQIAEDTARVPERFVTQVRQALANLRDRENVNLRLVGYTDDAPLEGRAARIYGTHLALSKARAHRVARKLQDALGLPGHVVSSDGRGSATPIASNATRGGRAMNQRVEIEFWYDDPLQELPNEPQPCPDPADAELVTKVYDPPWGRIEPIAVEDGAPTVPAGYAEQLERALGEIADKRNPRLRFVGYTKNERLDRRTADVYGDDVGLSAARARRTMEQLAEEPALADAHTEHEGRGYVHASDVVNAGFLQGETDHVAVQVVYDEPGPLGDFDGVDITPITRELRAQDPLALNLMHITVDGEPVDDPGRSSADIQRCTDVALDQADIRFAFDDLDARPRLSVTSSSGAVAVVATEPQYANRDDAAPPHVDFRMYTNYGHFIERSEVRIYERGQSPQAEPITTLAVGPNGVARWVPGPDDFHGTRRELTFVLRAYDAEGRFDETQPQPLWQVRGDGVAELARATDTRDPLNAGYGESDPTLRSIPLAGAGNVQVQGRGVPEGHQVFLAGAPIPVDPNGNFIAEAVLPAGMHTVEVAVLDPAGNGELFLRDLELETSDWFYVAMADVTVSNSNKSGGALDLQGDDSSFDRDSLADGRLAFFVKGRFGEDWGLTAHADTREGPVGDLFTNFVDKTPEALFRRLDADQFQPTFGDDGTVEEAAPTSGKFYAKLSQAENHAMWGNFNVGYRDNELAQVDRGLYGANLHYQTDTTTLFGEKRAALDAFGALPGTVGSREEFRGTGGSLYYLRVQDLLQGSDRLRIEVRDEDSGLVTGVVYLSPGVDYDIDYLQGRVLLAEPLASTARNNQLVREDGLDGDQLWLVVQYEYTPGVDELDAFAAGGQGHVWLNDFTRVGVTANRNDDDGGDESSLYATDFTLRRSAESWLKVQYGRSDGVLSNTLRSDDGGFNFSGTTPTAPTKANAYRVDATLGLADLFDGRTGRIALYGQMLDAGYSAPGLETPLDTTQYGGVLSLPLYPGLELDAKADHRDEKLGLTTTSAEADLAYDLIHGWQISTGARFDSRTDDSAVVALTQEEGDRVDAILQLDYDSGTRWSAYGFGQGTVMKSGDRDANNRYGLGGSYRVSDRLSLEAEVSHGDSGPALRVGSSFQETASTHRYLSYALENERGVDGGHRRRGNFISGARTRLSDSGSVYVEDRYEHSDDQNGLSRAMGLDLALTERWTLAANWELGTLLDPRTNAETERYAGGGTVAYAFEKLQLSAGVEYRDDDSENPLDGTRSQRTTWLFKNNVKFEVNPDWRMLAKFNHSMSESSEGAFFDGGYSEAVMGFAYRPVAHDRLNALAKYTWFSNLPTADQTTSQGVSAEVSQRSHVTSLDLTYQVLPGLTLGGKYAWRRGEVSLDRVDEDFFGNDAHLALVRTDYRFLKNWEAMVEGRMLQLVDLDERRAGALVSVHRYLGDHLKLGVGYNFTDFSEDLTDLDYDHHGFFFNFTGSL